MKATNEELMNYLRLMRQLMESGYKCEQEITRAINELNKSMFEQEKSQKVNVLIFEQENFLRTVDYYSALMDGITHCQTSRGSSGTIKYTQFQSVSKRVVIIKLNDSADFIYNADKFMGLRFDFIFNNTRISDEELKKAFGFFETKKYTR